jgi:hypothetical protein
MTRRFFRQKFENRNKAKEKKEVAAFKALQKLKAEQKLTDVTMTQQVVIIEDPK